MVWQNTKIKNIFPRPIFLTAAILLTLVLFVALDLTPEIYFFQKLTKIAKSAFDVDPTPRPGSNLRVCTSVITNNDCNLRPTLFWGVPSGIQVAAAVQVDNNGWLPKSPPSSFPSPEVDTGEIIQNVNYYTVPAGRLSFGTTYYWQVAVKDNFGSWSGWTEADVSFTTPSCLFALSVSKNGTGSGTVTSNPLGINCGSDCTESYNYNTSVTLTASASSDSTFEGWSGEGCSGTGTCTVVMTQTRNVTATFNITNNSPIANNLKITPPDYCLSGPTATFSWVFSDPDPGDSQSAYQIQVDNNSNFSSPEVDSCKINSDFNSYAIGYCGSCCVNPPCSCSINYNATYYWRVRVWDNHDLASSWYCPPGSLTCPGDSFATPLHRYPTINFSWWPSSPSANETVQFVDESVVYGGATKSSWSWIIPDAQYLDGTNSSSQNPRVKFNSAGDKQITLRVTDSDGYACQDTKDISVSLPLPDWREVPPQ